jgi:hypothetical protein
MRVLKIAVESGRWDLAAHTIVLAAAKQLENGRKADGNERKTKSRRAKG